ncbi:RNA polymerase sigma-70 factor [Flavihumibacter solisilvae]|uniref:RNA polymerase sigma-70 factor n=1 Tax=Flavihumibacter solisilvae TaxID=1349421 RepID=UPI00068DD9D3|nr:RNA polymerase sigma-70 factor [Flavihumibacter solisilvae]
MTAQLQLQSYIERVALFGDQEAFEKLYYHFYKKVRGFAMALVKSQDIAEEVTADLFVNLWKSRARLIEVENINLYVYVATRNLAVKHLEKNNRSSEFSLEELDADKLISGYQDPEETLLNGEMIRHLHDAIQSLPPRCRVIYKMVREDGLKYKEIATILNISVKTIDAQMAIATRRISQSIRFVFPERTVK